MLPLPQTIANCIAGGKRRHGKLNRHDTEQLSAPGCPQCLSDSGSQQARLARATAGTVPDTVGQAKAPTVHMPSLRLPGNPVPPQTLQTASSSVAVASAARLHMLRGTPATTHAAPSVSQPFVGGEVKHMALGRRLATAMEHERPHAVPATARWTATEGVPHTTRAARGELGVGRGHKQNTARQCFFPRPPISDPRTKKIFAGRPSRRVW